MNKKFTTLLASALLTSAFSVNAADFNPKKGEAVLLSVNSFAMTVNTGDKFGELSLIKDASLTGTDVELTDLQPATWKVSEKKSVLGRTVYSFVNPATGLTLAVDPTTAVKAGETATPANPQIGGGSASEWVIEKDASGNKTLVSFFTNAGKDSVVYFGTHAVGSDWSVDLKKGTLEDAKASAGSFKFALENSFPESILLSDEDLNTLLQSVDGGESFKLNMDPEVSKGQTNLLTATALKAKQVEGTGYVNLIAGENKYVVVDTAYYGGTETGKLLKYTYDKLNADNRVAGSYNFKFTFNAKKQELYAQVAEVAYQWIANDGKAADLAKEIKENNNNSTWTTKAGFTTSNGTKPANATDEFIYMAQLAGTNVLTVNVEKDGNGVGTRKKGEAVTPANQNVKMTIGTDFTSLKPVTIADGVYTIQYKAQKGNKFYKQNNAYALANLAGTFGWAEQATRQDFNHMPAAQWVVAKQGTSATAPVTITNREFSDNEAVNVLPTVSTQFFAVEGSDDVFYIVGSRKDTMTFHKVADELVKDAKLGYKYVTVNEAKVQTYTFSYLHGLAMDKFLDVTEDGVVRVNEKDGKASFRLELVVADDKYGYDDSLVRNVYYVSNGSGKYLTYDDVKKKYVLGTTKTPFFLKENNCVDGKPYYALVEANLFSAKLTTTDTYYAKDGSEIKSDGKSYLLYDENGQLIVDDYAAAGQVGYWYNADEELVKVVDRSAVTGSSINYAVVKASVDDNTLNLVEGNLDDKFINGEYNEIRTSAFAVETDDSPLYRRFNNANLGEVEGTDSIYFVEKTRGEYLMDEWNDKLQDKTVDYAGIWNKDKAEGKLAFVVDTAWVKGGLGYIKPQYLISVARNDQEAIEGIPCTYEHNHYDNAGNKVTADKCSHAEPGRDGFKYGKYLVSFGDSAIANYDKNKKELYAPYMDVTNGYTRVGFVEAIVVGDTSLIVLNEEYTAIAKKDASKLNPEAIIAAYKEAKTEYLINDLRGDNHKNYTWSFRYVTPSNDAVKAAEEGAANEFLFESNIYEETGASTTTTQHVDGDATKAIISVNGQATYGFAEPVQGSIAPAHAAWLKMQNGCLVLTRGDSKFEAAKTGSDGALIFNAYQKTEAEDMVTSNDEIAAEGIAVIAGNGTVTVQGAAGKSVVITNILGKVVAETVLTSDNATIAVPAGIVAVAVEGEEAVKTIVK